MARPDCLRRQLVPSKPSRPPGRRGPLPRTVAHHILAPGLSALGDVGYPAPVVSSSMSTDGDVAANDDNRHHQEPGDADLLVQSAQQPRVGDALIHLEIANAQAGVLGSRSGRECPAAFDQKK